MRNLFVQMQLRWALLLNNRKLTAIVILVPVILGIGIGNIFRDYSAIDHIPVAVIDNENSESSKTLTHALQELDTLDVQLTTADTAQKLLSDSQIEAIFTIEPGYEKNIQSGELKPSIKLTFLDSNLVAGALGDIIAREVMKELVVYSAGNRADLLTNDPSVREDAMTRTKYYIAEDTFRLDIHTEYQMPGSHENVGVSDDDSNDANAIGTRFTLGMTLAIVMFYMTFVGSSLIEERHQAAFDRLKCAGQPRTLGAFLGYMTFGVLVLFLQMLGLNVVTHLFPLTQFPVVLIILTAFMSCLSGAVVFLSTFFEKSTVFQSIAAPGAFFVCLAGGAFWSLELVPEGFMWISKLTPVYWTMKSLLGLIYHTDLAILPVCLLFIVGPLLSLVAETRV